MFDPKIERTSRSNNIKKIKKKSLAKIQDLEESFVSKQETMVDTCNIHNNDANRNNNNCNNRNKNGGGVSFHNSPRGLAHIARPQWNTHQTKMKTILLKILYANPFTGLDHEDQCTHLTKFYELSGTLDL